MDRWLHPGHVAVVTGGASGIGFAAAQRFAAAGMHVVLADLHEDGLAKAAESLGGHAGRVLTVPCDVSDADAVIALRDRAYDEFGAVHCLMNNAGMGTRIGPAWEDLEKARRLLEVNLWGVIHGCHAFIPAMLQGGAPGAIINTGSKQGITKPPGNYAYNLSKAGVLAYTESVAHGLRQIEGCALTAHLLVPGFVYTGMVQAFLPEKPPGAATAHDTVAYLMEALQRGEFYIICPDGETDRALDEKRIQWAADDLILNRPALSRWHPDFSEAFQAFVRGE